jgi:hypothetical protein
MLARKLGPAKPDPKGEHEDEAGELGHQCHAEHAGHVDVVSIDMSQAASNPGQKQAAVSAYRIMGLPGLKPVNRQGPE